MAEIILEAEINQVFAKLKHLLADNKCKITAENVPTQITVVQGSIWGTSAKTAEKKITYTLNEDTKGTRLASTAQLTSSYVNFALLGCVMSVALLVVCVWIAFDLQSSASGWWGWLAQTGGQFDSSKAGLFVGLTGFLAAFLVASISVEAVLVLRVRSQIGAFAQSLIKSVKA